jgi:hypothetical protein
VFVFFLPQIISFATAIPTGWDGILIALVLNIYSTAMLITRPLTNLMNLSVAGLTPALQLFQQAMPDAAGWLDATYPQIGGIANYMTANALNIFVFVLPFFLLLWGAIRAGRYAKANESGVGVGLKFAAKLTFGGFAGYAILWGVLGTVAGTWNATLGANSWQSIFIIFGLLVVASWQDLLFVFFFSAVLGAVGKVIGKKQVAKKAQKPAHIVEKEAQMAETQAPLSIPPPRIANIAQALEAEERYEVQKFCELCGTKLDRRGIFCPGCGARMRKEAPLPEEAPAQPQTIAPRVSAVATPRPAGTPELSPEQAVAKETKRQKNLRDLEKAIMDLNRSSAGWAIVFTILSIVIGGIRSGIEANAYYVLAAVFAVPFGLFAAYRDQKVFQDKIWKKNYSSRGIDMILVGLMGNLAGGAGLLILIKGACMLAYTTQKTEEYPKLNPEQWEARIYQEVNLYGAPLLAMTTFSLAAEFALYPLLAGWIIVKILLGVAVYYAYMNYVKQDLVQGNFLNAEEKCIGLGVLGCIVNGGGFFILIQGIILYLHRTKKLEEIVQKQAAQKTAATAPQQ